MAFNNQPNINPNSQLNNVIPVPTLSTLGFIYDSTNKFDKLLSHAFVADYNQTYLYPSTITSLPKLIEAGGNNLSNLEASIKGGLYNYFNRYYSTVDLAVSILPDPSNPDGPNVTFQLTISFVENNVPITLNRSTVTSLTNLSNIIALNNYG